MRTEPEMRSCKDGHESTSNGGGVSALTISLKTPASVKINPEPTLIKKTAETCETRSVLAVNTKKLSGTHVERKRDTGIGEQDKGAQTVEVHEWRESLGEGNNACIDDCANGSVVMERNNRVHLQRGTDGISGNVM